MCELFWSTCHSAPVSAVKVRLPELPLLSAWLDCAIVMVKACEALSTEPGT